MTRSSLLYGIFFSSVEDENFALFNYVNELSGNMELIQEAITSLRGEMKRFQEEGVALEKQRQVLLTKMEENLSSTDKDTQTVEDKNAGAIKVLQQLKSGLISFSSHNQLSMARVMKSWEFYKNHT